MPPPHTTLSPANEFNHQPGLRALMMLPSVPTGGAASHTFGIMFRRDATGVQYAAVEAATAEDARTIFMRREIARDAEAARMIIVDRVWRERESRQ